MKSVGVHLIRLCLTVEQGFDVRESNRVMVAVSKVKERFGWLEPPASLGEVTVADVADLEDVEKHRAAVGLWASSVWAAWANHHETVHEWVASFVIP